MRRMAAYGGVFAVLGVAVILVSNAAGSFVAAEAESGVLGLGATMLNDSAASGGKAVQFAAASPTPSPSPTGAPSSTCTNPVYATAATDYHWFAPGESDTYVNNNVWNGQNGGTQTINICNLGSWYVSANWINNPSSPGDIMSYPSVCECSFNQAMSTFHTLNSSFAESAPYIGEWNFAYDIFMSSGQEIMIDNDQNNHGTGLQQGGIAANIDGVPYHVIKGGNTIYILRDVNARSGNINFLDIYAWIVAQGWNTMSDKLNLFGYGVEISYTESSPGHQGPQRFDLTNFTLTAN
jgi:hypothetical protein